jgi:hypothetical protein
MPALRDFLGQDTNDGAAMKDSIERLMLLPA